MRKIATIDAKIAIGVVFAALLRCLGECIHLQLVAPAGTLTRISPYIWGASVSAAGLLVAVLFYFAEKWLLTVTAAGVTVLILLALRFTLL